MKININILYTKLSLQSLANNSIIYTDLRKIIKTNNKDGKLFKIKAMQKKKKPIKQVKKIV